jgi:hypothetical protein
MSVGDKIDITCGGGSNALQEVYYIGEGFDNFVASQEQGKKTDWFWKDATLAYKNGEAIWTFSMRRLQKSNVSDNYDMKVPAITSAYSN